MGITPCSSIFPSSINTNSTFELHEKLVFLRGDDKTMLASTYNSEILMISNQCADILLNAVRDRLTIDDVLDELSDNSDKDYFARIFLKLIDKKMIFLEGQHHIVNNDEMKISIDITNDCNLRCTHCCVSAGEGLRGQDLDTVRMKILLDKVIELNPRSICISGGEPLLRSDFEELIIHVSERYSGGLILMTNATLINDENANFICERFDQVDVSIDGVDEASCSLIRGAGVFDQIIRGIKLLKKYNCEHVVASMVLAKANKDKRDAFEELCEGLGIDGFCRGYDEIGRGKDNAEDLGPEIVVSQELTEEQLNILRKKNFAKMKPNIFTCGGCERELTIDNKGDIFPCGLFMEEEYKVGNVLEIENFSQYIIEREFADTGGYRLFSNYFPQNSSKCGDCQYSVMCWTCASDFKQKFDNNCFPNCKENASAFALYWE